MSKFLAKKWYLKPWRDYLIKPFLPTATNSFYKFKIWGMEKFPDIYKVKSLFFGKGHQNFPSLPAQQWGPWLVRKTMFQEKRDEKGNTVDTRQPKSWAQRYYTYERILNDPWMNCYVCFLKYLPRLLVIEANSLQHRWAPRVRDPLHRLGVRDKKHILDVPTGERRKVGLLQT